MPNTPPDNEDLVEWVTEDIIRQQFNDGQYYEKVINGILSTDCKRNSHPASPPHGEPVCTHSQILYYYDDDNKPVAVVHQYRRPDGTIGGSGRPDPKRLILSDRILAVRAKTV